MSSKPRSRVPSRKDYDQVVFTLQGGGALGSYQVGVYEGLLERGLYPDWIAATSIGAINAAIIAGNRPEDSVAKLKEFWSIIATPLPKLHPEFTHPILQTAQNWWSAQSAILLGQTGFFTPRAINPWLNVGMTPDRISFYDTTPLKHTLERLVDFDRINHGQVRLCVGAVQVETGHLVYFDSHQQKIGPEHIMASGALPPGFPAVEIEGRLYWDGGLVSNTPIAYVLEQNREKTTLCVQIRLFSPEFSTTPSTLEEVLRRKKAITFASQDLRAFSRYERIHQLLEKVAALSAHLPENDPVRKKLEEIHAVGKMDVLRFHTKNKPNDLSVNDYAFSVHMILERMQEGYHDAKEAMSETYWAREPENLARIGIHNI